VGMFTFLLLWGVIRTGGAARGGRMNQGTSEPTQF
jgi:hypothetical protein